MSKGLLAAFFFAAKALTAQARLPVTELSPVQLVDEAIFLSWQVGARDMPHDSLGSHERLGKIKGELLRLAARGVVEEVLAREFPWEVDDSPPGC